MHEGRTGKIFPDEDEVPAHSLELLEWAKQRYYARQTVGFGGNTPGPAGAMAASPRKHLQAFLDARGIGAEMAKGIDPDEYIRQLREGWE